MKGGRTGGYLMVLAAAVLWGSIGIFVNGLTALGVTSKSMAAIRLLTGAILVAPVLAIMGAKGAGESNGRRGPAALFRMDRASIIPCLAAGIIGIAVSNCLYFESMRSVGMSTASVLLYTSPVFGCALGRMLYKEQITPAKLAAIVCSICGCVLAVTCGDFSNLGFSIYGVAAGVASGFLNALLSVLSRAATTREHALTVTFWGFAGGGFVMAALAAPMPDVVNALSPQLIGLFFGFGLLPTAISYILYMQGQSYGLEASKVPVIASVETAMTVLVGIVLYAEPAGPWKIFGICLVIASIAILNIDFARMRQSSIVRRYAESLGFNPQEWKREKATDMEQLQLALDSWYFVR